VGKKEENRRVELDEQERERKIHRAFDFHLTKTEHGCRLANIIPSKKKNREQQDEPREHEHARKTRVHGMGTRSEKLGNANAAVTD